MESLRLASSVFIGIEALRTKRERERERERERSRDGDD
jgi:hypothetical protein